jgi:parallel beta-helix repeat protein
VGIIVNAFLSEDLPREESITGNAVVGNRVEASDNSGISTISNVNGLIRSNVVRDNGRDPQNAPGNGIGVQHLRNAQIDTSETVADNVVTGNAGAGIFIGAERNTVRRNQVHGNVRSGIVVSEDGHDNRILHNDAAGNVPTGPAFGAGDLVDLSTTPIPTDPFVLYDCDHNTWLGNIWGSGGFFPDPALGPDNPTACTTIGGHAAGGPVASAAAPRGSVAARPRPAAAEAGRPYELQPQSRGGAR